MRRPLALLSIFSACAFAQIRTVTLPDKSPVVTLRVVFTTGSFVDPNDKPGVADLTAAMLSDGGTKDLTYKQIVGQMFPMAASRRLSGGRRNDHLFRRYASITWMIITSCCADVLLNPGWREEDFKRIKDNSLNSLRVGLRGNNDEELGKEVLYATLYRGTPYGHTTSEARFRPLKTSLSTTSSSSTSVTTLNRT